MFSPIGSRNSNCPTIRSLKKRWVISPERALVLCVDEKSQIQVLDRTVLILPLRPGLPERQTRRLPTLRNDHPICRLPYLERQSHRQLLGASSRQRIREVSQPSGEASPSRPGRAHHSGQLQHAKERHRTAVAQIQKAPPLLFPLHPHQQFFWLNQVERFFALITERMIRRGTFRSVEEFECAIYAWLANWNNKPQPFVWKAGGCHPRQSAPLQRISWDATLAPMWLAMATATVLPELLCGTAVVLARQRLFYSPAIRLSRYLCPLIQYFHDCCPARNLAWHCQ